MDNPIASHIQKLQVHNVCHLVWLDGRWSRGISHLILIEEVMMCKILGLFCDVVVEVDVDVFQLSWVLYDLAEVAADGWSHQHSCQTNQMITQEVDHDAIDPTRMLKKMLLSWPDCCSGSRRSALSISWWSRRPMGWQPLCMDASTLSTIVLCCSRLIMKPSTECNLIWLTTDSKRCSRWLCNSTCKTK